MGKCKLLIALAFWGLLLVSCNDNTILESNNKNEQNSTNESDNKSTVGNSSDEIMEKEADSTSNIDTDTSYDAQKDTTDEEDDTEYEYDADAAARDYWLTQGQLEVPQYDRAIIIRGALELRYPKDGMYVFAKGTLDNEEIEDDINNANTTKEELVNDWLDHFDVLIFPKKYHYDDFQTFSYVQVNYHMLGEGKNFTDLKNSGSEELEDILNQTKEYLKVEDMEFDIINGVEYATSMIQTPNGPGYVYLTIQDGSLFLFFFDSYSPRDHLQELIDFKNYIMYSVFPVDEDITME